MEWFYSSVLIILSFLVVNGETRQDCLVCPRCLVHETYEIQKWGGEEVVFYSYIANDTVVRLRITYEALDKNDFFTLFYFSPSTNSSMWTETKNADQPIEFYLEPMNISNEWAEFRISSQKEKIYVTYDERKTVKEFNITQDAAAFDNLHIWTSSISLCKEEKTWKVSERIDATIPLGRDLLENSFHIKIQSLDLRQHNNLGITIFNSTKKLYHAEYILKIERTRVIIRSSSNKSEVLMNLTIEKAPEFIRVSSINGEYLLALSVQVPSQPNEEPVPVPISDPAEKMHLNNGCHISFSLGLVTGISLILFILLIKSIYSKRTGCIPQKQQQEKKEKYETCDTYDMEADASTHSSLYQYPDQEAILRKRNILNEEHTQIGLNKNKKLFDAVITGDLAMTQSAINEGWDVNYCDPDNGETPMYAACCYGNLAIVEELIQAGANKDHRTDLGMSPLQAACKAGHLKVVQKLLDAGSNANTTDNYGITPLTAARRKGHKDVVQVLLQVGCKS